MLLTSVLVNGLLVARKGSSLQSAHEERDFRKSKGRKQKRFQASWQLEPGIGAPETSLYTHSMTLLLNPFHLRAYLTRRLLIPALVLYLSDLGPTTNLRGFPGDTSGKEVAANAGDLRDAVSIPELGRSPGEEHGNPLQYSCLENAHGQRSLAGYSPWGRKESHECTRQNISVNLNSNS